MSVESVPGATRVPSCVAAWELNERHYGALQGLNKAETAEKHGADQVKIWRRSYDIPPPPLAPDDERHAAFIADELVPQLEATYPLDPRPAKRGLMGASFGAVAALSTAWRRQGVFSRLLLQSGSFAFTDIGENRRGPAFDPVVEFVNRFREEPGQPSSRLFVSCGMYESLIYENRSLVPLLQSTGMDVRYVEARDGHNWENWRDRLREGLSWLFPGPLWMVYE